MPSARERGARCQRSDVPNVQSSAPDCGVRSAVAGGDGTALANGFVDARPEECMRIAQLAPLYESVPPRGYGGTERVVAYLTEELVRAGHEVTLFATADSHTEAVLVPCAPRALRLDPSGPDDLSAHLLEIEAAYGAAGGFDIIHAHLDHLPYPVARRTAVPTLTTLHGRLDLPHLAAVYAEFREQHVVSISASQRRPLPWLRWLGTVHHGLPRDLYRFRPKSDDYLAFVGRLSIEKRVDRAIEIAVRTGRRLRIAAKVDPSDVHYFDETVRPLLAHPLVEFVGELDDAGKDAFLGEAAALLFPIDWPEPFGLVMIEALACGAPVIAWRHGSVEEVIDHGKTGFVCTDVADAVQAVRELDRIDRARCRAEFEERFTADRMARDYVALYAQLCEARRDAA
jgi:glycosyltransferase involved in cell wall biosynthesis